MTFYFFNAPSRTQTLAFRQEYAYSNLRKLRLAASLCLCISCGTLLLPLLFPVLNQTLHVTFYRGLNIYLVLVSALALAGEHYAYRFQPLKQRLWLAQLLCLLFAFAFVLGCLGMTFIAQDNPKNTLTMFLLGLVTVSFLWDFDYLETLGLAALILGAFMLGAQFTDLSPEQKVLNYCVTVVILVCFYVLSRVMFSYRVTHFLQVQEIELKNQQLQKVSQAKSEVLGVVAHDLRSPFNNIEMLTTLLRKKTLSPEQQQQYLDLILTSCQSSRHIINELLYLSREEQQENIPLEKVNLCELLQEVEQDWQTQLQGTRALTLSRPASPLYANLNKERFQRVMNNLLSNAVKFTPAHGQIKINVRERDQHLLLDIADQGIGIPEKFRSTLFERFSKARRRGLKGEKSTGLGLSICRQLVEQHGGSIDVESEEHQGTTFHIVLPAAV